MTRPPRYVFALFGRRRSGKSVFMAALRAVRRPHVGGVVISYVGALPSIMPNDTETQDEAERKRVELAYVAASEALSEGRVPPQTNTSDGIMGHRFEVTLPVPPAPGASTRVHVDIYDYAGELLALEHDELAAIETLRKVLGETDGLLVLAETPTADADTPRHRKSLAGVNALGEALSRLCRSDTELLKQVAFLATKWDHQHHFTCERAERELMAEYLQRLAAEEARHAVLFANWLEADPAAEQHHQLHIRLKSLFGAKDYHAWPVSAFGEAKLVDVNASDGLQAEVPARVPLASLNLEEPLLFLIERARARHRRELMAKAGRPPDRIGEIPDRIMLVAAHGEDTELLSLLDDLIARQNRSAEERTAANAAADKEMEEVAAIARKSRIWRYARFGVLAAVIAFVGVVFWDANRTRHMEGEVWTSVQNALARKDLDSVITARTELLDLIWQEPLLPTVRLLNLGYDPQDRAMDQTRLMNMECTLWGERVLLPGPDAERARARRETLRGCASLDRALNAVDAQMWRDNVRGQLSALRSMTDNANCEAPDFVEARISEEANRLRSLLDTAPTEARVEVERDLTEIEQLESECRSVATEAKRAVDSQKLQTDLRSSMDEFRRMTSVKNCSAPDFAEIALTDRRNELLARLDTAPAEVEKDAAQVREEIATLEKACKDAIADSQDHRQLVEERTARDTDLKKLDAVTRTAKKWPEYVQGLADFVRQEGATTSADLTARRDEVAKRLEQLVGELEDWRKFLIIDRQQGQSFSVQRSQELGRLKAEISALPGDYKNPKDDLLGKVAEIEEDFLVWNACTRFSDEVRSFYNDLSNNVSSRTTEHLERLDAAVGRLRNDSSIRDHVGDALDKVDQEIGEISWIKVSSVKMSGTLPGGSNSEFEWKWYFDREQNLNPDGRLKPEDGSRFSIQITPNAVLQSEEKVMFISIFQDRIFPAANHHFAMKIPVTRDFLVSELSGSASLSATKDIQSTIYQFNEEVTSSNFSPNRRTGQAQIRVTFAIEGAEGAEIIPAKCQ